MFGDDNRFYEDMTPSPLMKRKEVVKTVKTTELPLAEYIESTLNDVKTIINEMDGSDDDKKHLLDTIWMLANSAKDGCEWTVDFGFPTTKNKE